MIIAQHTGRRARLQLLAEHRYTGAATRARIEAALNRGAAVARSTHAA